jgi:hypothetical protein
MARSYIERPLSTPIETSIVSYDRPVLWRDRGVNEQRRQGQREQQQECKNPDSR